MSVIPATRGVRKGLRGAVLSLLQEDADPDAREHGEQEGGESADQEVLGELAVLQGPEAGEHTSGLQSLAYLVFRLLVEKKKKGGGCGIQTQGERPVMRAETIPSH